MRGTLLLGEFHPDLEAALARRLRETCPDGDARRLLVVVPNRLLAVHLRRRAAELGAPTLGLQPRALEDLNAELARPVMEREGWRELPGWALPMLLEELVERQARRGYFKAVADLPGLYTALAGTLRDLRDGEVSPAAFAAAAKALGRSRKISDLVEMMQRAVEGLERRRLADGPRLGEFAALALHEADPASLAGRATHVFVYGIYDLLPRQRRLLEALAVGRQLDVFFPWQDSRAFDYARPLREWFEARGLRPVELSEPAAAEHDEPGRENARLRAVRSRLFAAEAAAPTTAADGSVRMVAAPNPAREALEILRHLSDRPASSALVLLRREEETVARLRGLAQRAGLPLHLPADSLAGRPAGRAARLLLALVESGARQPRSTDSQSASGSPAAMLPRTTVEEILGTGALAAGLFEPQSRPGRWAQLLRRRGVVARRDDWEALVERYAGDGPQRVLPFANADEEEDRFLDPRLRRERPPLARWVKALLSEIDALAPALRGAASGWPRAAHALAAACERWLAPGEDAEAVLAAAGRLAELEGTVRLSARRVRTAFERQLESAPGGSSGPSADTPRFGAAATVSSLAAARGITADRVLVPGLVEGAFPRRAREDPLLLDEERAALNAQWAEMPEGGALPLKAAPSMAEERLLFRLAVGAARRELVLLWPRAAPGGREAVPSTFVLEVARALLGHDVDFRGLYAAAGALALSAVPVAPPYPEGRDDGALLLPSEFDLRVIDQARAAAASGAPDAPAAAERLSYLTLVHPRLRASFEAEVARRGGELTAFDGTVGETLGAAYLRRLSDLEALHDASRKAPVRLSASRLQTYALCSFKFFLENALGARSEPAPERFLDLGAGDLGTLYHAVLRRLFDGAPPLGAATLGRAQERLEELLAAPDLFDDEAPEPLRRARRHRMREDLGGFLAAQAQSAEAWRPRELEAEIAAVPPAAPLVAELGPWSLSLRGRVDRIDEGPLGLRIVDYKTGKLAKEGTPDPPSLAGGRNLQLAYYRLALLAKAARESAKPLAVHAAYFGVSAASGFRVVAWGPQHFQRARPELERVVDGILGGIERGEFFQVENERFCRETCDFSTLCGAGRQRLIARKSGDPRAALAAEWRGGAAFPLAAEPAAGSGAAGEGEDAE